MTLGRKAELDRRNCQEAIYFKACPYRKPKTADRYIDSASSSARRRRKKGVEIV
jgi:hypothetical protein